MSRIYSTRESAINIGEQNKNINHIFSFKLKTKDNNKIGKTYISKIKKVGLSTERSISNIKKHKKEQTEEVADMR